MEGKFPWEGILTYCCGGREACEEEERKQHYSRVEQGNSSVTSVGEKEPLFGNFEPNI